MDGWMDGTYKKELKRNLAYVDITLQARKKTRYRQTKAKMESEFRPG
jgi:hypothetical protein